MKKQKFAISPQRQENFPDWYQEVVKAAEMAEMSSVRGCMVIRPWGYGIWQNIQSNLDAMIQQTGHENVYFPLFIPMSYIEKEAAHVEGFAKEMAVVTHHRLEKQNDKLIPCSPLPEPLIVRPTSETVIGASMAKWVQSYRDLPLLLNQWANVVRWEMRPRIFLRTTEFLWQEGHTAHATAAEAHEETAKMLNVYQQFLRDYLAIPVYAGEKPASERFPGAEQTLCVEAMMQDGKALQAGTSHFLGQNFAKAAGITFTDKDGQTKEAYTTSWGMTSRLIGALLMVHGDDNGLRLPPNIAPQQVVLVLRDDDTALLEYAQALQQRLQAVQFFAQHQINCRIDRRDMRMGDKYWSWVKKGVPLVVNIGKREVEGQTVSIANRDGSTSNMSCNELVAKAKPMLNSLQANLLRTAEQFLHANTRTDVANWKQFQSLFKDKSFPLPFVRGKWCESRACQQQAEELGVTVRCVPFTQEGDESACILCGKPATVEVIFAKAY